MTDFGRAGPHQVPAGKKGQFQRTILVPWTFRFSGYPPLISLVERLAHGFTVMESTSTEEGKHTALIIDNMTGKHFDIEILWNELTVYPKGEDHQDSSEKILMIVSDVAPGILFVETRAVMACKTEGEQESP